jgi:hypothetical protein
MEIYFLANTAWRPGKVQCFVPAPGLQPELWDPVADTVRDLRAFRQTPAGVHLSLEFAETQSYFLIFRRPIEEHLIPADGGADFPVLQALTEIDGSWRVSFDPQWGGPASIQFDALTDWTAHPDPGIRYYSGTATYVKEIDLAAFPAGQRVYLDLGTVRHLAEVTLNGKNLGVVWTAPWRIEITEAIRPGNNRLEIAVTNVWANRLIGDEQHPPDVMWQISDPVSDSSGNDSSGDPGGKSGSFLREFPAWFLKGEPRPVKERLTFTTWNYFTKDSPLTPSGLMGPVQIMIHEG